MLGRDGFIGRQVMRILRERHPSLPVAGLSRAELDLEVPDCLESLACHLHPQAVLIVCAGIKRQWGDTAAIFQRNLAMAAHLHQVLVQHPVARVIYFSSAAIYGEELTRLAIDEETPLQPTSLYALAKATSEQLLTLAQRARPGFTLVRLRPPLVYGPVDRSFGYGPAGFTRAALLGEPINLWGDGSERRGMVHVHDVAEVLRRLVWSEWDGPLDLAEPGSRSYRELLKPLAELVPAPLDIRCRERTRPLVDHAFTGARLRELFPDLAWTSLADGLRSTLEGTRAALAGDPDPEGFPPRNPGRGR